MTRCSLLVLALSSLGFAQTRVFQSANPHYPTRNPFYFEGKIDYEKLGIASPSNAWEYAQRGIHRQDDLEDIAGAMAAVLPADARHTGRGHHPVTGSAANRPAAPRSQHPDRRRL